VATDERVSQQRRHLAHLAAHLASALLLACAENDAVHAERVERAEAAHTGLREAEAHLVALTRAAAAAVTSLRAPFR
jgi:hypothetical protein